MQDSEATRRALPGALRTVVILTRRELRERVSSVWLYVVASASCVGAAIYGGGFLNAFHTETVLVSSDPLAALNATVLIFLSLVLGLRLSASLSWEREHRTLEVLLVGPVGMQAIVLSKFAAEFAILVLLVAIYSLYVVIGQPMGAGTIGLGDTVGLWRSLVLTLPVLALGLLVSGFFSSVRASVVCYLIVVVGLSFVAFLTLWLSVLPPGDLSLAALYLRSGLEATNVVLRGVSALSYLSDLVTSVVGLSVVSSARAGMAIVVTAVSLGLTVWVSSRQRAQ